MAGLSNIFNNDGESSSSSDQGLDNSIVGDLNSTLGLDATNSSTNSSTDEDGATESSTSDQSLALDTSTDGLLGSVTDAFSSSDQTTDN